MDTPAFGSHNFFPWPIILRHQTSLKQFVWQARHFFFILKIRFSIQYLILQLQFTVHTALSGNIFKNMGHIFFPPWKSNYPKASLKQFVASARYFFISFSKSGSVYNINIAAAIHTVHSVEILFKKIIKVTARPWNPLFLNMVWKKHVCNIF